MLRTGLQETGKKQKHSHVGLAHGAADIRDAQRLRWQVFAEEMGARLNTPQPDIDLYVKWCDHLLAARHVGSFYAEHEFDLTRLSNLRGRMVEIGRSCVHPDYRKGGVITLLWSSLAEYMQRSGHDYLIGCASIGMQDGGHNAAGVWHAVREKHLAPVEWRVTPRCPLPLEGLGHAAAPIVPPLIKGYLRLGAWVCGAPAWDPDFNTADLMVMLSLQELKQTYAKHFLSA